MELKSKKPIVKFDGGDVKKNAVSFSGDKNDAINTTRLMEAVKTDMPKAAPSVRISNVKPNSKPKLTPAEIAKKKEMLKKKIKRRDEQIRTFSHIFASLLLIVFIVSVSAFLAQFIVRAFLDFTGINVAEYEVTVEIPADATTEEIAEELFKYDVISMPGFFEFYSRVSENDDTYLSGSFRLNSTMSYNQIIYALQNRPLSTETVEVKIIEGMTAREIGLLLEEKNVCRAEDFVPYYKSIMGRYSFERRLEHKALKFNQMEGYLFPDTYEFYVVEGLEDSPDTDTSIYAEVAARTMFSHYNSVITPEMYRKIADLGETLPIEFGLDEFMTLASMVQWEAADPEDMKNVASVFFNRLQNPEVLPKLESDVTDKYIEENLKKVQPGENDALMNSIIAAYDTYEIDGLPPGPVCNPGMNAILAVLDAPKTNYLYFCAEIETGKIYFAENAEQHKENLEKAGIDEDDLRRQ